MGVLSFRKRRADDREQLMTLLHAAQSGDAEARNQLISSYIPFVLRIASQSSRRYIDKHRDDEYSIALSAFNEAVDGYDATREVEFLSFAQTVIKRRLIDYFRSRRKDANQRLWSDYDIVDDEDNVTNYAEVSSSLEKYQLEEEATLRRYEIEEFQATLKMYGLSFSELVEISPKHADARENAFVVAQTIVSDEQLTDYVTRRKALPLKDLENRVALSRKTLERQRKYILALVLLLCGNFPLLQEFVSKREEVK